MADSDDEPEYEVERILAERKVNGSTLFLVKWKDYGDEECTWEPRESFNFDETIDAWTEARNKGDILDDAMLEELQTRMLAFQNRARLAVSQQQSRDKSAKDLAEKSTFSTPIRDDKVVSPQRPANLTSGGLLSTTLQATPRSNVVNRPSINTAATTPHHMLASASERPSAKALPSKTAETGTRNTATAAASRAGKTFRNLSHQNNYRKRARDVDSIAPAGLQRISLDELPAVNETDTAHILPSGPGRGLNTGDSWMFVPEPSDAGTDDAFNQTPTTPVLPAADRGTDIPARKVAARDVPATEVLASSRPTIDTKRNDGSSSAVESPAHTDGTWRTETSEPIMIRAQNGREWFKHDVMVSLSMGKAIGDVKFAHMPWMPYAKMLVDLKVGPKLTVDFNPGNVIDRPMYNLIFELLLQRKAVGLVEPFTDTEGPVNEFAAYLEKYDSAGFWIHPANGHMSMILYSCSAPSWRDIGKRPARVGQPVSRLHFAVFQGVPSLPSRRSERTDRSDTRPQGDLSKFGAAEASSTTPTMSTATVAKSTDPRLVRRRSSLSITTADLPPPSPSASTHHSASKKPTTLSPSARAQQSPFRLTSATSLTNLPQTARQGDVHDYEHWMQKLAGSSTIPELTLDFQSMSRIQSQNSKLDQRNINFYISFTKSHPKESALTNRWLQGHTTLRHIWSDRDPTAWKALRQRAPTSGLVILFHPDNPLYFHMSGLGEMLNLDFVQCYSLLFNSLDYSSTISVISALLFPRCSTFLLTESNIVESPQHALFVTKYFAENKKLGWMIVFRPRIRSWLKELAMQEGNQERQQHLFTLLVVIDEMSSSRKPSNRYCDPNEDLTYHGNDGSTTDSYLISPSSLPDYHDDFKSKEAITRRDRTLIEYFCGFAGTMAPKCRRFWIFHKEQDTQNSGHVFFQDLEKFVKKQEISVPK